MRKRARAIKARALAFVMDDMSKETGRLIAYLFVLTAAMFAVYTISKAANDRTVSAAIRSCELAKADRIDSARAATAQAHYLEKVLVAVSVKQDVKDAATASLQLWSESANQQRRRLYDCKEFVMHHKLVIDRDALLEAQGQL